MQTEVIVISGAAGALGTEILKVYLEKGHDVVGVDNKPLPPALRKYDSNLTWVEADISVPKEIDAAIQEIQKLGTARLLINAVGMIHNEPVVRFEAGKLQTHDVVSWNAVLTANLTAPFLFASAIASLMVRCGQGCIINFSSVSAKGISGQSAYSAAKAGIEAITHTMSKELGPMGVRVNAIAPGFIDVLTTRGALSESRLDQIITKTSINRLGDVGELVKAVLFLHDNEFANGTILKLDGGFHGS